MTPSSSSSLASPRPFLFHYPKSHEPSSRNFPLVYSLKKLSLDARDSRNLVIAGAKKKKKKVDSHSFYASPDEATWPFPEAILLKKVRPWNGSFEVFAFRVRFLAFQIFQSIQSIRNNINHLVLELVKLGRNIIYWHNFLCLLSSCVENTAKLSCPGFASI